MSDKKEIKGVFKFDRDSKRYHRFKVESDADIIGTVYIPKSAESMPKRIILESAD